jgi:hypothetical protein
LWRLEDAVGREDRRDDRAELAGIEPAGRPRRQRGAGHRLEPCWRPGGGLLRMFAQARVPNMPGPGPGMKSMPAGIDPNSPQFQKAVRECVRLVPADAPPDLVAHPVGPLLAFVKCMRKHGVTSFPDPDSEGHFQENAMAGIDMTAPIFQRAQKTCLPLAKNEPLARVSP